MFVEANKDRTTCIIEEENANKIIETELNNQDRDIMVLKKTVYIMLDLKSIRN